LRLHQIAFLPAGLLLIAYLAVGNILRRNWRLRYELTIGIRTPKGHLCGSSVIEVTVKRSVPFWGTTGIDFQIAGKAPAVELPDGRLVFALLKDSTSVSLPALAVMDTQAMPIISDRVRPMNTCAIWSRLKAERPEIHIDAATMSRRTGTSATASYPDVIVLDPAEVTSIRAINPVNAEPVLGPGFTLTGLEIRIVGTPPDTAFDPSWLPSISDALDRVASSTGPMRHSLNPARFVARGRN
jgi:hypothetical protein